MAGAAMTSRTSRVARCPGRTCAVQQQFWGGYCRPVCLDYLLQQPPQLGIGLYRTWAVVVVPAVMSATSLG